LSHVLLHGLIHATSNHFRPRGYVHYRLDDRGLKKTRPCQGFELPTKALAQALALAPALVQALHADHVSLLNFNDFLILCLVLILKIP
jgi:hypothetical protein